MKIRNLFYVICLTLFWSGFSMGAAYDIKPDAVATTPALVADRASVTSEKVMDGITDVVLTLAHSPTKTVQRVILQCDATQQTVTSFYYLKDTLGGKAKGATGFQVNVYNGPDQGYLHNGDVMVYDSQNAKDNLRNSFNRLKQLNGVGYISFEFFETHDDIDHTPIAHTMLLPSSYLPKILAAMDKYPESQGCNIPGGFVSVYELKSLKDAQ